MEVLFWSSLFIVFYTYVGYGLLVYLLVLIKRVFLKNRKSLVMVTAELPSCSLVITAYNEEDIIEQKIQNTLSLSYPRELFKVYFVTDGSSDRTPAIIKKYPDLHVLHDDERKGKVVAMDRAMHYLDSEIVIFTDANTFLNSDAIINICQHYSDKSIGGVAGEKRVFFNKRADASSAGEGMYWRYESQLKAWDSELYSVVGTAGELFSIRTELYKPVPPNTILDDFTISMQIAEKGYKIVYEPNAYAVETASANVKEELKRKIRIAAGGIQAILRLKSLLNPFKQPILSFQYISHRVLRWTLAPLSLLIVFSLNIFFVFLEKSPFYTVLFYFQVCFYSLAIIGWFLERKHLKTKITFIPYYFCVMNYAVLAGIIRFFRNKQDAVWVKARRK